MSQNLAQLCALLIEDIYGPFFCEIFSTLTAYGRLHANSIAQRCHLPLRKVRSGLGVLVQLRFVYHHTASDGRATYEANTKGAYSILRTGKLVQVIQRRFGYDAGRITKRLVRTGQASVGSLEDDLLSQSSSTQRTSTNGPDAGGKAVSRSTPTHASARKLLQCMAEEEYIVEVRDCHFQTWSDARQDAEAHVVKFEPSSSAKGKAAQLALDGKVDTEMRKRARASLRQPEGSYALTGSKRLSSADDYAHTTKRPKLGDESCATENLADDLVVCLNFGKIADVLRDERLANRVAEQSGTLAGQLCAGALLQLHGVSDPGLAISNGPASHSDVLETQIRINVDRLLLDANTLDPPTATTQSQNIATRIPNSSNGTGSTRNGHVNGDSRHNLPALITPEAIEQQLQIVSEGEEPFISRHAVGGNWIIDIATVKIRLLRFELFHYIRNRFGLTAMRIIRILADKGKVDEKWLQEIGLLSAKDLRQAVATLHTNGYIELQEIPREPQRQPNRTMFLWFFDFERAQKVFLEDIYKCMARLLQRIKLERQRLRSTLDKVERSDVRGKEEILLPPEELKVLKQWRTKERWLLVELGRLDETVAILRDV